MDSLSARYVEIRVSKNMKKGMVIVMKVVVVIPAYQPGGELIGYVDELLRTIDTEVVVVDDGSADEKKILFKALERMDRVKVLYHTKNKGKGYAIKTAVRYLSLLRDDVDGIVTADADSQHSVADVSRMIATLCVRPNELILGVRTFDDNTPKRSRAGNAFSAMTLRLLYGINLNDTQTGLRAIGREHFDFLLSLKAERYEYELDMLIYSRKRGINIYALDIDTIYYDNNSASHFHTFKDGSRVLFHMFKGLFQYVGNSFICAFADIALFTFLFYMTDSALGATVATSLSAVSARVISSIIDFRLNRETFASKEITSGRAYIKYYTLWIVQLTISTVAVNLFNIYLGAIQVIAKPIIDLTLAIISYKIQLHWVFVPEKRVCKALVETRGLSH